MKKEKIIIYGGSFDPPHKAHFKLLKGAIKEIKPDKVYVVTGWQSPFKSFPAVSYKDREKMFRLGAREFNLGAMTLPPAYRPLDDIKTNASQAGGRVTRLIFHPFEYKRRKVTYTYQTADYFHLKHPRAQLFFLMGSDCLNSFNKWKKYKLITKKATLLVGRRKGFLPGKSLRKSIVFLKGIFPEISSTDVKKTLFIEGVSSNIPDSVSVFIQQKKLYLNHMHKWLKLNLTAKRVKHCKETTRFALELAEKHGLNLEKTATAALLHDAARDFGENKLKLWAAKNRQNIPFFRDIMANAPFLFHSYMSSYIARTRFSIKDTDILNAIILHTIGAPGMSILAKTIYVSDIAGRDRIMPSAPVIRKKAFLDIDKAFFSALKCKLDYIKKEKKWPHPRSKTIYQALLKQGTT